MGFKLFRLKKKKKRFLPSLPSPNFVLGHQNNCRQLYSNAGAETPSDGLPVLRSNGHKNSSPMQYGVAPAPAHSSPATNGTNSNGIQSTGEPIQSSKQSASSQNSQNGQSNNVTNVSSSRVGSGAQSERERLQSAREQHTVVPLLGTTQPLLSRLGASTGSNNGAIDIYVSYPDRCDILYSTS